jgi:putative membrane protein
MWHMGEGRGWWMLMGWLWVLLFWGLVARAVYTLVTRSAPACRSGRETAEPSALEVLERRYARGELSDEQFEAMRELLMSRPLERHVRERPWPSPPAPSPTCAWERGRLARAEGVAERKTLSRPRERVASRRRAG